jgi:ubiquitin-conjugating enzyme E2 O
LDGSVEVTLPNGVIAKYPLERLTRLYDTLEQLEDLWGEFSAQDDPEADHIHVHGTEMWAMDEDGVWQAQPNGDENDEWEETDEEEDYVMDVEGDTRMDDAHTPDTEIHTSWWDHIVPTMTAVPADQQDTASVSQVPSSTLRSPSPDVPRDAIEKEDVLVDGTVVNGVEDGDRASHWKRFEILPQAPHDHAFYNSTASQPSRNFLTRLQKEYRALSSSLPGWLVPASSSHTFTQHLRQNPSSYERMKTGPTCSAPSLLVQKIHHMKMRPLSLIGCWTQTFHKVPQ